MRFYLVDQILSLERGKRIVAAKNVSLAEEYLADHFPDFPVLPGVLMLEAAIQTAAWLVRDALNFAPSLIVLKEVRGVRYGTFVLPGNRLVVRAEAVEIGAARSDFKIKGTVGRVDGPNAIQARLVLSHLTLAGSDPTLENMDSQLIAEWRRQWNLLAGGGALAGLSP